MYTRRLWGAVKSLLHFDYPHYYADGSGLKDEASPEQWRKSGNASFVGRADPSDEHITDAPRFGYRCLKTSGNDSYVSSSNSYGTFSLTGSWAVNIDIFVYVLESLAGIIWAFMDGASQALSLSLTESRSLVLSSAQLGLNLTVIDSLTLSSWHHVRAVISGGTAKVYIDGAEAGAATFTQDSLNVSSFRIGGCGALFDEFCYRIDPAFVSVPVEPYRGALDITKAGGFGDGHDGELNHTGTGSFSLNTCGVVKEYSGTSVRVNSWIQATYYKSINPGDEIMFLVKQTSSLRDSSLCGRYAFRHVVSIDGTNFTIDRPVSEEFSMDEALRDYTVTAYKIPNLTSLTFTNGKARLKHWIFAARATGNIIWGGSTVIDSGQYRHDDLTLCHSDLPDRMPYYMGNILMFAGGTFSAPEGARIGNGPSAPFRPGGIGGSSLWENPVMVGGPSSRSSGYNILIAARTLEVDYTALCYGARHASGYSGCCYLAGDVA